MQIDSRKQNCPKPTDLLLLILVKTIDGESQKSVRTEILRVKGFLGFFSLFGFVFFIYNPILSLTENGQFKF